MPYEAPPVETELVGTEPVGTEPVETELVGTEPVGTELVGTEPVGTELVGTELVGTELVETEHTDTDTDTELVEAGHSGPALVEPFGRPLAERRFEDYQCGLIAEYGTYRVTREEIIDFGRRFDPHDMHVDPELAKGTPLGELVASGWHTTAMMMRILVESYLNQAASVASPGVDELRWLKPVRPGDSLRARFTVLDARPSATRPDRGVVRTRIELLNQERTVVMTQVMTVIMLR